jgi:hypothetical protein
MNLDGPHVSADLALDIDALLEIAYENVTRTLTDEECRRYLYVASSSADRSVAA